MSDDGAPAVISDVQNAPLLLPQEPARFMPTDLDRLVLFCVDHHASDITIQSGSKVLAEVYGKMREVTVRALSHAEVSELMNGIYGANAVTQILSGMDIDTQYEVRPLRGQRYRFRVNGTGCYVQGHEGIQITMRSIPLDPPRLADMNLPQSLIDALIPLQGIIIVAGATGSGKSTLLSSIMREILETKDGKILTYESPIEFVYDNIKAPNAIISQHEVPKHLPDFPSSIRNALRRKPTYILVGEARDAETISAVIDAALTGHTVYTTVHSNGVADTIRRMVSAFKAEERHSRSLDLVTLVRAVIWQALLPSADGKRVALREWLIFNEEVRNQLVKCDFS